MLSIFVLPRCVLILVGCRGFSFTLSFLFLVRRTISQVVLVLKKISGSVGVEDE